MLTGTQLDQAVATRALVRITEDNGYHKGVVGIALGFRPTYGNVKIGFIDADGKYTGDYTVVSYKHVELMEEPEAVEEPEITVEAVEQVLRAADFPHCVDPAGRKYGEFQVASLVSGVRVTYSLGAAAAAMIPSMRRAAVAVQVDRCERVLSRLGYRVTVFEPDRGTRYALTVR